MKKKLWGIEMEISDWNQKLKITAYFLAIIAVVSSVLTLSAKITIPGLTPLATGCTMMLLGIREFNAYFKIDKSKGHVILGIILTLIFVVDLYVGFMQIFASVPFGR